MKKLDDLKKYASNFNNFEDFYRSLKEVYKSGKVIVDFYNKTGFTEIKMDIFLEDERLKRIFGDDGRSMKERMIELYSKKIAEEYIIVQKRIGIWPYVEYTLWQADFSEDTHKILRRRWEYYRKKGLIAEEAEIKVFEKFFNKMKFV